MSPIWPIENFDEGFYGDGSDGDVTINAATVTLARDMYYNNLTITGTGILISGSFRIFVRNSLNIQAGGILHNSGNSAIAQVGGVTVPGGSLYGSHAGGNGQVAAGSAGGANVNTYTAFAVNGGNGGAGTAGAGGAGGANPAPLATLGGVRHGPINIVGGKFGPNGDVLRGIVGGPGGGGGGGNGVAAGGGGGAGGGVLILSARYINNQGIISVSGGDAAAGTAANCGGGGGGAGGILYLTRRVFAGNAPNVSGGVGGASGGGAGVAGAAGQPGLLLEFAA